MDAVSKAKDALSKVERFGTAVIDKISDQTSLPALNATIEAAQDDRQLFVLIS